MKWFRLLLVVLMILMFLIAVYCFGMDTDGFAQYVFGSIFTVAFVGIVVLLLCLDHCLDSSFERRRDPALREEGLDEDLDDQLEGILSNNGRHDNRTNVLPV